MNNTREKILIIRLSSIGDILLASPFLRQTRKRFPKAQIDFLVKQKYSSLVSANPYIDRIIQLEPGDLVRLIRSLKSERYDYIFDLHNNVRSRIVRSQLNVKHSSHIKKNKIAQQLFVRFKINRYYQPEPIPARYLAAGRKAGIEDDKKGLEFYWEKQTDTKIDAFLRAIPKKEKKMLIAIAPGAGFYTKRWPINYFAELIKILRNKYQAYFVVLGDQCDHDLGKKLHAGRQFVINLTGKIDLMEAGALLSHCRLAITNDSGMMHMAAAVGTPVTAIFGSSVKQFGFFPYRTMSCVVENNSLKCRPCSHIGRSDCPHGHFKCMLDLTPELVYEMLTQFIERTIAN